MKKATSHSLHILAIFLLGLFTGALLRNPIERSLHLDVKQIVFPEQDKEADSRRSLPVVTPILEKASFTIAYDGRCKNPYYLV